MLDRLILKHLTKTGVIAYFVGQITLFAIWAFYLLGIKDYSMDEGRTPFYIGMIVILLGWSGVCLIFWKKPKEEHTQSENQEEKAS